MTFVPAKLLFPVAISAAALVGLIKTLLLAALLQPSDFGRYAAFAGMAAVATVFISLGRIEQTTKAWPRAWEAGSFAFLRSDFLAATQVLVIRALLIAAVATLLATFACLRGIITLSSAAGVILGSLLIVSGMMLLLNASGLRAAGSMRKLLTFTAARSGIAMAIAVPLGAIAGWEWALAGELIAQSLVASWSWFAFRRDVSSRHSLSDFAETTGAVREGRMLYASNLIGSLVPFGGRGFIALIATPAAAGTYAVAMVFVQVAQMFAGSVAQREGPLVLKLAQRGEIGLLRQLRLPAMLLAVLAAGSFAAFLVSTQVPQAAQFWASYNLGPLAIGLTTIAMLAAFHMQLSFVLLALDAERHVLRSAIVSAAVTYGGFLLTSTWELGVPGFIASVAVGEALRAIYMLGAYLKLRRARDHSGEPPTNPQGGAGKGAGL